MKKSQGISIYVKDCIIPWAHEWLTTFLTNVHPVYEDETTQIFRGEHHGHKESVILTKLKDDPFLEINCSNYSLPWKTHVEFARYAFLFFRHEVRCIPERNHHPGEFWIVDADGERLIDWDEEME
jgi:hypothetical protein